jgi:hypothetical protein
LQRFFPGSFSFSLGVLVTPGFEEENELASETLKVIVISFHRLHHRRHILAGYDPVICLQFHRRVLVNFQLSWSILALLTQPDLASKANTSWTRFSASQNSGPHFTEILQTYQDLGSVLHKLVDSPVEPSIG